VCGKIIKFKKETSAKAGRGREILKFAVLPFVWDKLDVPCDIGCTLSVNPTQCSRNRIQDPMLFWLLDPESEMGKKF
jgi:hypothetical protein